MLLLSNPNLTASIADAQNFSMPVSRQVDTTAFDVGCSPENFPQNGLALPFL
jgi:hypothetical protein